MACTKRSKTKYARISAFFCLLCKLDIWNGDPNIWETWWSSPIVRNMSGWPERRCIKRRWFFCLGDGVSWFLFLGLGLWTEPRLNHRKEIGTTLQLVKLWQFLCPLELPILDVCQMSSPCLQTVKDVSCINNCWSSLKFTIQCFVSMRNKSTLREGLACSVHPIPN